MYLDPSLTARFMHSVNGRGEAYIATTLTHAIPLKHTFTTP